MQTYHFDHEPSFAELWDVCVYNLLYKVDEYKRDLETLLVKSGVTKKSKIIDVASGGGFPSLDLILDGYQITCTDGFADEVELFNRKAEQNGVIARSGKVAWKDLPRTFEKESFDFLLCRGNSFIYAGGGWNAAIDIVEKSSLDDYLTTLGIFYDLLKTGSWIYLDKFKDDETTHREKVCEIQVNDNVSEDLIFWTERFPKQKIRQASMVRKVGQKEQKTPNVTYDLSGPELELLMSEVGFKNLHKITLPGEQHFDIWVAQK